MYDGDSFFTLSTGGQIGLALLSLTLAACMIWLTWAWSRRRSILVRLTIWAGLFAAYLWLSPQIFYFFYMTIIDGLPLQVVIDPWPDPAVVWNEIFPVKRSLASDARMTLGLMMLAAALGAGLDLRGRRSHEQQAHDHAGRTR